MTQRQIKQQQRMLPIRLPIHEFRHDRRGPNKIPVILFGPGPKQRFFRPSREPFPGLDGGLFNPEFLVGQPLCIRGCHPHRNYHYD